MISRSSRFLWFDMPQKFGGEWHFPSFSGRVALSTIQHIEVSLELLPVQLMTEDVVQ